MGIYFFAAAFLRRAGAFFAAGFFAAVFLATRFTVFLAVVFLAAAFLRRAGAFLAGLELLSYSVGPLGGQLRAGTVAAITTLRTSVISGGLICIAGVSFAAGKLPQFRNYDSATNEFAIAQRNKKKSAQ